MAKVSFFFCVLAMWAIAVVNCAAPQKAPSLAPAPVADCSTLIFNMVDCLSYVSNGSKESKPQGSCCSGLKTVLKADAECLCEAFKSSAQLGIVLNVTKATSLPAACGVSAPSISNCGLSNAPGAAPGTAPAHSPKISPSPKIPKSPAPVTRTASSPAAAPTGYTTGGTSSQVPALAPAPATSSASAVSISFAALVSLVVSFSYILSM